MHLTWVPAKFKNGERGLLIMGHSMGSLWLDRARYWVRASLARAGRFRPFEGAQVSVWRDLVRAGGKWELCIALAYQKAIARFRGSFLGSSWIVLGFAISCLGIAWLWAELYGRPFDTFVTHVSLGFFAWNLTVSAITDGARALLSNRNLILQTRTPIVLYPAVTLSSAIIAALHYLPFVILVMVAWGPPWGAGMALAIPGIILLLLTALGVSISLSIWCVYLPDVAELIATGLRFVFFFTPILWMPDARPALLPFLLSNPFFHAINIVRGPLVGADYVDFSFAVMAGFCVIAWVVASLTYWRAAGAVASRL